MENLNNLSRIDTLLAQPSFTADDARELGVSAALLAYYIKKGQIRRLGRGIYQGVDFKYPTKNFRWKNLIEAVNSVQGGVVCLMSALALYDITDQVTKQFWIGVPHGTTIKREEIYKIIHFRNMELGRTTMDLNGIQISIFDRERTIIDSFRLLSPEIAIRALKRALAKKGKEQLDQDKLLDYSKKLRFNIYPYLLTATT